MRESFLFKLHPLHNFPHADIIQHLFEQNLSFFFRITERHAWQEQVNNSDRQHASRQETSRSHVDSHRYNVLRLLPPSSYRSLHPVSGLFYHENLF